MEIARRHLIDDQKAAVALAWKAPIAEEAREAQIEAGKGQADQGKQGGRGKKKTLRVNSPGGFSIPKTREPKKEERRAREEARLPKRPIWPLVLMSHLLLKIHL